MKRKSVMASVFSITSPHQTILICLFVDTGEGVISKSLQLIAGRTEEYNLRKKRIGAFWEDRYHATAVQTDKHLAKCLIYIDLNMVRAGVVAHPSEYSISGYNEIQSPSKRYSIVNLKVLNDLFAVKDEYIFRQQHREWVDHALQNDVSGR